MSDLVAGQALAPLAFVRRGTDLQLMRFEAETQELAIQGGKAALAKKQSTLDAWAFAREGLMDERAFELSGVQSSEAGKVDVLAVDAWSHEMKEPITVIQAYQPFASGAFKVLGQALIVAEGATVEGARAERLRKLVYAGVQKHEKVAPMWKQWRSDSK
ncbi:MAG: hypothetical protein HZA53_15925 [Planctomycetes bacterium]|nr:hypothetical protein [Planctomycetota bacterium]